MPPRSLRAAPSHPHSASALRAGTLHTSPNQAFCTAWVRVSHANDTQVGTQNACTPTDTAILTARSNAPAEYTSARARVSGYAAPGACPSDPQHSCTHLVHLEMLLLADVSR